MTLTRRTALQALASAGFLSTFGLGSAVFARTPKTGGCTVSGTPEGMSGMGHGSRGHGSPMTGMHGVEFDQVYIDMMLPHHASIIALAETALPMLTDSRLKAMARDIIDTQSEEQTMMRDLRGKWYGSREPGPMTHEMMNMSMGHASCAPMDMDEMMNMMDPEWEVETFLAADDPDLAFIDQTIPHHQMAIDSSEVALEEAVHPELKEIAQDVIEAQQREIDTLELVRAEITGEATPESTPSA